MNQQTKTLIGSIFGALMFSIGTGLRLKADALSTHPLRPALVSADNAVRSVLDSTQMQAINDIALALLWAGVAVVVLSIGAWVFRPSLTDSL